MRIQKEKVHPLIKLVNSDFKFEKKLMFNQQELDMLNKALEILNKASELWIKNHPEIEPHENQFFIASVELDYILREDY